MTWRQVAVESLFHCIWVTIIDSLNSQIPVQYWKIKNKPQQKSKVNAATGILPVWAIYCWAIGLWGFWMSVVCGIAWRKVHLGWIFTPHCITQNWRYWNSTQDYCHSLIHSELSSCDSSKKHNVNTRASQVSRKKMKFYRQIQIMFFNMYLLIIFLKLILKMHL